jgi:hypothetical protein
VISGRIVDQSALAALLRHNNLTVTSWLAVSSRLGMTIWIPELARIEVMTLHRNATPQLLALAAHPQVLIAPAGPADAAEAVELLDQAQAFDPAAALTVLVARRRGWPVLSGDPHRLLRLDPNITVEPI